LPLSASAWAFFRFSTLIGLSRRDHGRARSSITCGLARGHHCREGVSRPHSSAFIAGHDAPLVGDAPQRAGTAQRKVAMSASV